MSRPKKGTMRLPDAGTSAILQSSCFIGSAPSHDWAHAVAGDLARKGEGAIAATPAHNELDGWNGLQLVHGRLPVRCICIDIRISEPRVNVDAVASIC